MSYLTCPSCTSKLLPDTRWRIPVDVCSGCGAIWFDAGEFGPYLLHADQRVRATSNPVFRPTRQTRRLSCPTCRLETLTSWEARGIDVLACSRCRGVLLPVSQVRALRNPRKPPPSGPDPDPERSSLRASNAIEASGDLVGAGLDLIAFLFPKL